MARRKARRGRKVKTAEKVFMFDLSEAGEAVVSGTKYLDIGQIHSLCNRVSARQGYEYVVQSLEIGCQGGGSFSASVYRLPQHWPAVNAWEKAMTIWKEQQDDAAAEAGLQSTRARYRDFKIHFDEAHQTAGFSNNLLPSGYAITDAAGTNESYEWQAAEVIIPNDGAPGNTGDRFLHMLGPDNGTTSSGLIVAYAQSRSRPQQTDPNIVDTPAGGLYGLMQDVGDDMVDLVNQMQEANDVPPYLMGEDGAEEYYPGGGFQGIGPIDGGGGVHPGVLLDVLSIGANQNFNTDQMGSFIAPCGLIKLEYTAAGVAPGSPPAPGAPPMSFWLKLTLAPGHYKGLMARPMQDVN